MMLFRLYEFFKVACVQCRGIEPGGARPLLIEELVAITPEMMLD